VLATYRRTRKNVRWHFFVAWNARLTESDLQTFQWTCGLLTGSPDLPVALKPDEPFAILEGVAARLCLYRKEALGLTANIILKQFLGLPA
jgi:hypothetical protein